MMKKLDWKLQKNYKQTRGKQKIANVSSVNECHKIDTSSRTKNWTHEIETKCARPVQDGYYFVYGKRIVSVLLRRTQ